MNLEHRLRRALGPVPPSPDFSDAVLARIGRDAAPLRRAVPRWALAASVLVGIAAGYFAFDQQRTLRGEQAAHQLAYALELTSRELETVQARVNRHFQEKGT